MTAADTRPIPALTPENEFFWRSGADGVLRFKRCRSCGTWLHPPLPNCWNCLGAEIGVEAVSGLAKVAAFTINHQPWHPAFPPPYALAIVELDEAPYVRLTTRIVGCEFERIRIGLPVRVQFEHVREVWLPCFTPVAP